MGTEYFLVKPSKSEIFYLGRHIHDLEGVQKWCYTKKADYISYENAKELFAEIILETDYCTEETTIGEVGKLALAIYEWCDVPVYFDSDISGNEEWKNYTETGSILTD